MYTEEYKGYIYTIYEYNDFHDIGYTPVVLIDNKEIDLDIEPDVDSAEIAAFKYIDKLTEER